MIDVDDEVAGLEIRKEGALSAMVRARPTANTAAAKDFGIGHEGDAQAVVSDALAEGAAENGS